MARKNRLFAKLATDIDDTGNITTAALAPEVTADIEGAGTAVYDSASLLPIAGNTAGDTAFVKSTSRLYIHSGVGWYNVAVINNTPTVQSITDSDGGTTPFALATDGTPTTITITAQDSDGDPLTYNYSADINFSGLATLSQADNVFTITPFSVDSATTSTGTITFTVTDGINTATPGTQTFTLAFGGQAAYTTPGTYSWTAPSGVTSISVVAIGGGGGGAGTTGYANGGAGGGLGYKNNIAVVPGQSYAVVVGAGGSGGFEVGVDGGNSYFDSAGLVAGNGGQRALSAWQASNSAGGTYVGDGGGNGGGSLRNTTSTAVGGAGGAGGYSGNGGTGGDGDQSNKNGADGAGGGGGGGSGGGSGDYSGAGGGTGIYGEGANGAGGVWVGGAAGSGNNPGTGGGGGSGGDSATGATGGLFGGGGRGADNNTEFGDGGGGAVRIIWGSNRSFPSTNTADL